MRKPEESLDDFTVRMPPKAPEPPDAVSLYSKGRVKVLEPLARWEHPTHPEPASVSNFSRPVRHGLSWFHRSLAVGGALAMAGLILTSAIVIGISDERSGEDVATVGSPDVSLTQAEEPSALDIYPSAASTPVIDEVDIVPPAGPRRRPARRGARLVGYRPRRPARRSQPLQPKFVPTTLIIYAENGEIKTRVEPSLTAVYKKPLVLSN